MQEGAEGVRVGELPVEVGEDYAQASWIKRQIGVRSYASSRYPQPRSSVARATEQ
ncbi:hypothetical protein [Streptomyces sp. NPDC003483]